MSIVQDEPIISPVLQHILYELLLEKMFPGPIYEAFDFLGHTEPFHFIIMNPLDININDIAGPGLARPQINRIFALQDYYFHLLEELEVPMLDDFHWLNIIYSDIVSHQLSHARHRCAQQQLEEVTPVGSQCSSRDSVHQPEGPFYESPTPPMTTR